MMKTALISRSTALISGFVLGLVLSLGSQAAHAQATKPLGKSGAWEALTYTENGSPVCYMGAVPDKAKGNYTRRGDTFVLITHRPGDRTFDVFSVEAGYSYKDGSEVTVSIGGQTFKLFTQGGNAFAYDDKADTALVRAMKRGSTMVIKGQSSRGTLTTDTYSLKGFTASHGKIDKACR
ncbi:MAG: invasion associated locus B family protein [Magnetovibrionaceae bacterium]